MVVNIHENTMLKSQSREINTPDVNWKYFIESKIKAYFSSQPASEANKGPLGIRTLPLRLTPVFTFPALPFTCLLSLLSPSHSCHTSGHYSLPIKKDGISTDVTSIKGNFNLSWKI